MHGFSFDGVTVREFPVLFHMTSFWTMPLADAINACAIDNLKTKNKTLVFYA